MIYSKNLRRIAKVADLNCPERVEEFVFRLEVTNKYRNALFDSYGHYCKANEIKWDRPEIRAEVYPIKVPTEENIAKVIACASLKYAAIFHLSKHGLRPDEISKITLRDLDLSNGFLSVRTSKMGLERTLKLKPEAFDLLRDYVNRSQISNLKEKLFASSKVIADSWRASRKKAYQRFKNTELLKIRLYDLRHWFGTTEYIKTRDIFHVKYLMGHRNIESTLHYMHVAKGLVNYSDDYTVKVASSIEEFTELLESGFEYVSDYEGRKVLRKRK
jgi:integrase